MVRARASRRVQAVAIAMVAAMAPAFASASAAAPTLPHVSLRQSGCGDECYYDVRVQPDEHYELRVYRRDAPGLVEDHGVLPPVHLRKRWSGSGQPVSSASATAT